MDLNSDGSEKSENSYQEYVDTPDSANVKTIQRYLDKLQLCLQQDQPEIQN